MVFEEKADFKLPVKKGSIVKGYGNGFEHTVLGEQYGTVKVAK